MVCVSYIQTGKFDFLRLKDTRTEGKPPHVYVHACCIVICDCERAAGFSFLSAVAAQRQHPSEPTPFLPFIIPFMCSLLA